jgi:putative membrane protein
MAIAIKLLLWVHLIALIMGFGGAIGMSQIGPRLIAAGPGKRDAWWPMAKTFSHISAAGLVLLLITGPLLLWLKFGDMQTKNVWFQAKLGLVVIAIIVIGLTKWGDHRLKHGDEGGGKLISVTGPLTGLIMMGVVLAAVFAFG